MRMYKENKANEMLGFGGKELVDLGSLISLLPNSLSVGRDKFKVEWKPNQNDKSSISASISIPAIQGKKGSWLQSIIVLSVNIAKKIFSMSQRLINTVDHKEVLKKDTPYYKNEPYKNTKDLLGKIKDSFVAIKNQLTNMVDKLHYNKKSENYSMLEAEKERTDVIVKVGNKWRILGKKVKYWPAEYDTKADAEAALRAYWANKHESFMRNKSPYEIKLEFFNSFNGNELLKKIGLYLRKIFGPTFYFDHITDDKAELFYKGKEIAKMAYNNDTEELSIIPDDNKYSPVAFYDTSEYEINDYLSDLLLGELKPNIASI